MKRHLLTLLIVFYCAAAVLSQPADNAGELHLLADISINPWFMETEHGMNGIAVNGSFFAGWGTEKFMLGGELWEHYASLSSLDDPYNYYGAWNILRGTVTMNMLITENWILNAGLGGAWYSSAFSSDDIGTYLRSGAALSLTASGGYQFIPGVLSLILRNRFDFVFLADEYLPVYCGEFRFSWKPGSRWPWIYTEAGLHTFIQEVMPRHHESVMFIFSIGARFDLETSDKEEPVPVIQSEEIEITEPEPETEPVVSEVPEEESGHEEEVTETEIAIKALETGTTGDVVTFTSIIFHPDSPVIKEESYPVLDRIADVLLLKEMISVEIRGHTNDLGDPKDEFDLSLNRAESVRMYLAGKGVVHSRMKCAGLGSEYSRGAEITEANRKVEFRILSE